MIRELLDAERGLRACRTESDDRLPAKDCRLIAAELDRLRAENELYRLMVQTSAYRTLTAAIPAVGSVVRVVNYFSAWCFALIFWTCIGAASYLWINRGEFVPSVAVPFIGLCFSTSGLYLDFRSKRPRRSVGSLTN
jgi:hypothetical protein